MSQEAIKTDILVIGSGIAGLSFALGAAPYGQVTIITKKESFESNTNYAQGGIAVAVGEDDAVEDHYRDTLSAGASLCDPKAVELLVRRGPEMVQWLLDIGCQFDRARPGRDIYGLDLTREGGHGRHRIAHRADKTGAEIERALLTAIRDHPEITLHERCCATSLVIRDGQCWGASILRDGKTTAIHARCTLIATGGCGEVYLHTTNPAIATGDGISIAAVQGAVVSNMEFIQFHPTSLYGSHNRSFLISEAVRGEGALLIRKDGYRFMPDYDIRAELAPRDIVARAIDAELHKTGDEFVLLDMARLGKERIERRFPTITEACRRQGIDPVERPIPVVPAAHYSCGGIETDLYARTSIPNLFACGEAACTGVHGANRLASNSLLEALVFARQASEHIAGIELPQLPNLGSEAISVSDVPSGEIRSEIRALMQRCAGIVRSNAWLTEAHARLEEIARTLDSPARSADPDGFEVRSLVTVASLIVAGAIWRKESRGLHYTIDYPAPNDDYRRPTRLALSSNGDLAFLPGPDSYRALDR
ncbi:MAG: L-aspartate oxidase [Armatimonadetes bacterium]|nr:L-aspartate oxidase [Armatimonadota bacterium]